MATRTKSFGVGKREAHDSSPFYDRALKTVETTAHRSPSDELVPSGLYQHSAESMHELPDAPTLEVKIARPELLAHNRWNGLKEDVNVGTSPLG